MRKRGVAEYQPPPPCPTCGGRHIGHRDCPYTLAPCVECGAATIIACSDCAIDSGGKQSVHVCEKAACRAEHEKKHPGVTHV